MISFTTQQQYETYAQLAEALRHIAEQLEQGMIEGYYPSWSTFGEDEKVVVEE